MEALEQGKGRNARNGALIVMRDLLLFLSVLAMAAILYRIAPDAFLGGHATLHASKSVQAVAASPVAAQMAGVAAGESEMPLATELPITADTSVTIASADIPAATAEPIPTPAPTAIPTVAPTIAPPVLDSATSSGDFSAAFPTADTGAGALHSYQSDTLRVAISKVQESGVTYFVADVWVRNIDTFATAFAKGEYGRSIHEMPRAIANDNNAIFAVSGDYYGARDTGVVIRNGKLYRDVMNDDVCVLRRDGTLSTYVSGEFSALTPDDTIWQAWAFGPALVKDGTVCDTSHSKIKVKNPRCGVGCYEPGHYCFIVVDGRQDGYSSGMTLDAFAKTFQSLGVTSAYNLDGGATAQMIFRGEVVNHQTKGGRAVSDILCFGEG